MFSLLVFLFQFINIFSPKNLFLNNEKYLFSEISNMHLNILQSQNFTQINVKEEYETQKSNNQNAVVQNFCFHNNKFRKVRITYFKSEDKEMFNSIWYPSYSYDCPILSIDLASFTPNKSICFVNLFGIYNNSIYNDRYVNPLIEIKQKYPYLSEKKTNHLMPFSNVLSDSMLYGHIYNTTMLETQVPEVLHKYFSRYFSSFFIRPVDRLYIEEKQQKYNKLREKIDLNFITKDYFHPDWYSNFVKENYR